jgi:hypothetical protein
MLLHHEQQQQQQLQQVFDLNHLSKKYKFDFYLKIFLIYEKNNYN